jgi:hypothetical protein
MSFSYFFSDKSKGVETGDNWLSQFPLNVKANDDKILEQSFLRESGILASLQTSAMTSLASLKPSQFLQLKFNDLQGKSMSVFPMYKQYLTDYLNLGFSEERSRILAQQAVLPILDQIVKTNNILYPSESQSLALQKNQPVEFLKGDLPQIIK